MALLSALPKNPVVGDPRLVSDLLANDEALRVLGNTIDTAQIAAGAVVAAKFATLPRVQATKSVGQSIPNNTITALTWDTESYDTDGMHSTSVNTSRLTCVTAGLYLVQAQVYYFAHATGYRSLHIYKNTSTQMTDNFQASNAAWAATPALSIVMPLIAGDYVEAFTVQTSGGAATTGFGNGLYLAATWIGP